MSNIRNLIENVELTHEGLGNLVAILLISSKAKKLTLVVSPSGCGKSTAMSVIGNKMPNAIRPDRISVAGLCAIADRLTSFRSVIVVDDIATTQTDYARKTTITTLVALVYTHRIESVMANIAYEIEDFHGSALIGIQPILLRDLMLSQEWDASIQDKALRYYHLNRPLKPVIGLPKVDLPQGIDIENIEEFEPNIEDKNWIKLQALGDSQWSRARSKEHLKDMLKAIASLEARRKVEFEDYALLAELLKPMAIENIVVEKEQLEGDRLLDNNLLALLCEYYTYGGKFALAHIASDYKLSLSQCYRIMQGQNGYWQQISKSPSVFQPSSRLKEILKQYSLEIKK